MAPHPPELYSGTGEQLSVRLSGTDGGGRAAAVDLFVHLQYPDRTRIIPPRLAFTGLGTQWLRVEPAFLDVTSAHCSVACLQAEIAPEEASLVAITLLQPTELNEAMVTLEIAGESYRVPVFVDQL